jgi:hypothetical protein
MSTITSNYAKFTGDNLTITGNFCKGRGRNCMLTGNYIEIYEADGATITGNFCTVWCENPASITNLGNYNTINGLAAAPPARGGSFTGGNIIINGVSSRGRHATRVATGGIAADTVSGCTIVNHGVPGVGGIAAAMVRNCVVTSSRDRERDRSDAPAKHTCMPVSAGEMACIICMANRVDALLQPCGHTNTCMDCVAKLRAEKSACPTCSKPISGVVAAVVGGVDV